VEAEQVGETQQAIEHVPEITGSAWYKFERQTRALSWPKSYPARYHVHIMGKHHYCGRHRREAKAFIRPDRIARATGLVAITACVLCAPIAMPPAAHALAIPPAYVAVSTLTGWPLSLADEHEPSHTEPPEQTRDGTAWSFSATATTSTVPRLSAAWPPLGGGVAPTIMYAPGLGYLAGPHGAATTRLASLPPESGSARRIKDCLPWLPTYTAMRCSRLTDQLGEPGRSSLLVAGQHVSAHGHRDHLGAVAEPLADRADRLAVGQQDRGVRVPEP
jgi:hypothetical protein